MGRGYLTGCLPLREPLALFERRLDFFQPRRACSRPHSLFPGRAMPKVLFVLKSKSACENSNYCSSGLFNSASMVADMLEYHGVPAKVVEVVDNNGIDREVHKFKPDFVVVEALWVVPEKFDVLVRLHPRVKWIVRIHSNVPFLASEGVAVDWIRRYMAHKNVSVAFNDPRAVEAFKSLVGVSDYLPNYYHLPVRRVAIHKRDNLHIGCFGAIRPMKNQLLQALAAVRFADEANKTVEFHINGGRCEDGGNSVLKNLRAVFVETRHSLVEHPWLSHKKFLDLIGSMDVAMSVSMTETFCITAADAVAAGTPLICSPEVAWASHVSKVPANSLDAIVDKLHELKHFLPRTLNRTLNHFDLEQYSKHSKSVWLDYLGA